MKEKKEQQEEKLFDMPIKTVEDKDLLQEMRNAKDGDAFVLDTKQTKHHEGGGYDTTVVVAQIHIGKDIVSELPQHQDWKEELEELFDKLLCDDNIENGATIDEVAINFIS